MADEFTKYANAIAMREAGLRDRAQGLSNMTLPVQSVAQQTGASSPINPDEVPSIAGLASMRAGVSSMSDIRQKQNVKQVKNLPKYTSAYRNYLQWRYPTRYGGGSGSTQNPYGDYDVPQLPGITGLPGMPQ